MPGKFLLPYDPSIDAILRKLVEHSSKEEIILTGAVLRDTLRSLTNVCPIVYKSVVTGYGVRPGE